MRTAVRALLVAVVAGGILFLFLLPGRTWLEQSRAMSAAQRRASVLAQENAALTNRVNQLHNTAYIEQVARQQYGLVMPGEKAFGILLPEATTTVPPAGGHAGGHGNG
ncbi:MAG TPA: septum formation initiator family protein [Acidimicrobiales bacterium]|nr:septum formation initiator family protein [Acidimicrobiales bacterium]